MKQLAVSFDRFVTGPAPGCKILLFAAVLFDMGLGSVGGQAVIRFPRHDWTVQVGGLRYGLVEYGPLGTVPPVSGFTVMFWGKHQRSVNLNIFVVAAVPIVILALVSFVAARVLERLGEARNGEEAEADDDAPT